MKSNSEVREMADTEKQREVIEAARRWEEDMAVHRMELQNIAAHEVKMQMAKQKESEMKEKQFKKETEPTLTKRKIVFRYRAEKRKTL